MRRLRRQGRPPRVAVPPACRCRFGAALLAGAQAGWVARWWLARPDSVPERRGSCCSRSGAAAWLEDRPLPAAQKVRWCNSARAEELLFRKSRCSRARSQCPVRDHCVYTPTRERCSSARSLTCVPLAVGGPASAADHSILRAIDFEKSAAVAKGARREGRNRKRKERERI